MSTSRAWLLGLVTAAATLGLAAPSSVHATSGAAGTGWVRFGHFAPAAEPVDVSVDGVVFASDIAFKTVSEYLPLSAGTHRFEVRPVGHPEAAPVLGIDAVVPAAGSITISAVSSPDGLAASVFDDALTQPPEGQALVRFVHAAPIVDSVDIRLPDGTFAARNVAYLSATSYLPISPGQYDVDIVSSATGEVLLHITGWSIAMGVQSSVIVVQGVDGLLDVAPVRDSVATAVAPTGGVPTGDGGMASLRDWPGDHASSLPAAVATVAVLVAACRLLDRRRTRCAP